MKVLSFANIRPIARGTAVTALVAALALGAGALPIAMAEVTPAAAPVTAPSTAASTETASVSELATPTLMAAPTPVATPAAPVASPRKLTVREIIAQVGRECGLSKVEIETLMWMAKRESNFHPTSHSRSECHGLFQLSKGMAHGHPWKDAAWNTKRAIKYMRGRYGGVRQAKSFWVAHHWY